ncbi:hypothetical protein B0H15DRAFT_384474 [Mycena belliarum]|uniref:Uncharacterized protein n=1 Tax=Mycena belliarum TaxID=1033014 RepID=A0AAD6TZM9_9AGAR|nr:hypothetical protein B0H15DRAFT_384474 [Mycena belliae]
MPCPEPAYFVLEQPEPQARLSPSHIGDTANGLLCGPLFSVRSPPPASPRQRRSPSASLFSPGLHHIPVTPPTPAELLSGAYAPAALEYFPRRAVFHGRPSLSIVFRVHRQPAPYLSDILRDRVRLDGAEAAVMRAQGWSRTRWLLDWPGYDRQVRGLVVAGLTRAALAKVIATEVALFKFLREAPAPLEGAPESPWAARNVHFGDVRLVALNYYGRVRVPVLALDAVPEPTSVATG